MIFKFSDYLVKPELDLSSAGGVLENNKFYLKRNNAKTKNINTDIKIDPEQVLTAMRNIVNAISELDSKMIQDNIRLYWLIKHRDGSSVDFAEWFKLMNDMRGITERFTQYLKDEVENTPKRLLRPEKYTADVKDDELRTKVREVQDAMANIEMEADDNEND